MAIGPGKYDAHVTRVREEAGAAFVLLAVLDPDPAKCGFSVQCEPGFQGLARVALRKVLKALDEELPDV